MHDLSTRRRALVSVGAVGLSALAGCLDAIPGSDDGGGDGGAADENDRPAPPGGYYDEIDFADPEGSVEFVTPTDGESVENPVQVEMSVEEFELVPTEAAELDQGEGHLHVIVDQPPFAPEQVIPHEHRITHLDEGGTRTELDLEPGEHDLVAQTSDGFHVAYDMSDEITVDVGGDGD